MKTNRVDTLTHHLYVPDRLVNKDGSVNPSKVRWHVIEKGFAGKDYHYSYATIQDALVHAGNTPTPVVPCGLFAKCEHCAKAIAA